MSKAHEEGGNWASSEHLASAFVTLGIAEAVEAGNTAATAGEDEIETICQRYSSDEVCGNSVPLHFPKAGGPLSIYTCKSKPFTYHRLV